MADSAIPAPGQDALPPGFTLLQVIPGLDIGGAERTTIDIAEAVVAAGGRALVASRGGRLADILPKQGAEFVPLPVHSKNPFVMAANAWRLARLIRREKVSLIHVRSRAPAFAALWAARATGIPLVATYHGVYNARSAIKRWYNAVMTRGDAIIANSHYTRQHVIDEHGVDPEKVVAVPRGVRTEWFDPTTVSPRDISHLCERWGVDPADRRTKVMLPGRLTRWKGQTLLIEAAARLKQAGRSDFVIYMVGSDQGRRRYSAELMRQIKAAQLEETVRLVGFWGAMQIANFFVDIVAAPSLDPEAFGRTAVEAQLMGRPVLAADHGAARETVVPGVTGWLVEPGDPDAWAKALAEALDTSAEQRAVMGKAGRARTLPIYSVEAMCAATLAVYAKALKTQV